MQSHLPAEVSKSFDAMVDAEVSFKGCLAWRGSRTRAKISGGQVFIFAMFNPEVVPTEEGRLITRA
jgi:hypothetical protein